MAKFERRGVAPLANAIKLYMIQSRLSSGHNTYRIFEAWDKASGASQYVTNKFFKEGTLYVTMNSSMARTHLNMQLPALLSRINQILKEDSSFIWEDPNVGEVKRIKLK